MSTRRLFDVDRYAVPDTDSDELRDGYLLPYCRNTRHAYESDLKLWWRWCADRSLPVLDAKRIHIETYEVELRDKVKPATRQRKLIAICGFYEYCEQEGAIGISPGRYVRRPRVPKVSTSNYLERYEVGPFLAAAMARGPRHSALCHLLVYNGLRVSEAVATNISDLTFAAGHRTLHIVRKGGAEADVPLAAPTYRAILLAIANREEGPILLDYYGHRMTRDAASRAVRLAAKRAGIRKTIGPHALRHTWISLALDAGVPLRDIQVDAGHADPSTTVRYDRRGANMDRHATYTVAAYVGAGF